MKNKKKTGKKTNTLDAQTALGKKVYRPWLMFMLIGPAVFFLLYWLAVRSEPPVNIINEALPMEYVESGTAVSINQGLYKAGKNITFSKELKFANNTVVAEAGHIFAVIPLEFPASAPEPNANDWWLLDQDKAKYKLLKVTADNPLATGERQAAGQPEKSSNYFTIFKIKEKNGDYYLVYKSGKEPAAWHYRVLLQKNKEA